LSPAQIVSGVSASPNGLGPAALLVLSEKQPHEAPSHLHQPGIERVPSVERGDGIQSGAHHHHAPPISRKAAIASLRPPRLSIRPASTASCPIRTVPTSRTSSPVRNIISLSFSSVTDEFSTMK